MFLGTWTKQRKVLNNIYNILLIKRGGNEKIFVVYISINFNY